MRRILVTGAGGFIGDHLVRHLKSQGHWVRGADLKPPEFRPTQADEFKVCDLRRRGAALQVTDGVEEVWALAADMGGMGYISANHLKILEGNLLINLHTVAAARECGVKRLLFSSSACVYPNYLQTSAEFVPKLRESDAYPADPQDAYGWEKLTTEKLVAYSQAEGHFEGRIARFHNIFGPYGTWVGNREKAPAALCRKIATAKVMELHEIEVWGDGQAIRSYCYIDDCLAALDALMTSDYAGPLNIGQDRGVTVDELAGIIAVAANWPVKLRHVPGPQGVRARNSDNSLAETVLQWKPQVGLEEGLKTTYHWIEERVREALCG